MITIIKFARSAELPKIISGVPVTIILFCGIDVKNKCSIVGFEHPDRLDDVYYLSKELNLVTSWRAMKIIELVEHINGNTIEDCWKLAGLTLPSNFNNFLSRDGSDTFFGFIREIFTAFPEEKTLESMRLALRLTNR